MPREPRIPGLRRVLRIREGRIERDVEDEIAFHLESRVRELIARGQPEAAARRHAEAEFGDLTAARRELAAVDRHRRRRERAARWLDTGAQDLRHAVRSLRRSPAFTLAAVLTLVIGIGASVAMFAVLNGVLLRPLPFGHPERLVAASFDMPPIRLAHQPQSAPTYFTIQRLARTLEGIGVYREGEVNVAEPGGAAEPERVASARITATLLPVLQTAPLIGHAFTEAEDRPGAPPVMLIAEGMWRTRFGADPGIVGRKVDVNGVGREIVGVMPAGFHFPSAATAIWYPLQLDPVNPPPAAFAFGGVARLKPGVTAADAERDFATVLPRAAEEVPLFVPGISTQQIMDQVKPVPVVVPLRSEITGGIAGTLWMVAAAAALLLLVASANVANLGLVRADARQRELAVRAALGAGRARVLLYFLAESAVLAFVAAGLGLALAAAAVRALVAAGPAGIPRLAEVHIDARTVLFTFAVAALVAAGCSLLPALRAGRGGLSLSGGERGGTAGRVQHRVRGGLVAAQIALALVVLAGSGLLLRTFERLRAVRPGWNPDRVASFWVSLPPARYQGDSSVVQFHARLVARVAALPGVAAVGLTSRLPLEAHGVNHNPLYPEDDPSYASKLPPLQLISAVNPEYFRAIGIPLVAGRTFARMEGQREGDAIVSQSTARFFWNDSTGAGALGKRFRALPTSRWYTVIGVVGDTRDTALTGPPSQAVYFPVTAEPGSVLAQGQRTMALVVRTTGDPEAIAPAVQRAVRELDPTLPVFDVRPMTAVFGAATAQLAFVILILGGAAAVTLILGAVGLYGVLAYVVTLRTRELGIRMALGASPRAVAAAMARYGIALTGAGIAGGLALFVPAARFLRARLFGVAASDPLTLAGSALILLVVALLASWVPARRAARVDPAEALRAQ
jgi:putative ABC transport system permease protein